MMDDFTYFEEPGLFERLLWALESKIGRNVKVAVLVHKNDDTDIITVEHKATGTPNGAFKGHKHVIIEKSDIED